MKKILPAAFLSLGLSLSGCGEPAPAAWNANLDIDCYPQDPFDKTYAFLSPEKFWREQEYDMGTLLAAGRKNLEMSRQVLDDSTAQQGQYLQRAQEVAAELGLSGAESRAHVKANMDRYAKEVQDIEMRLKQQEEALSWVRKCARAVQGELRKRNLSPVKYDPEKRPM